DYDLTTGASDPDGVASANDPDNEIPVTLVPAEGDLDNDFIEDPFPGSITGHVNDDAGSAINGILISLYHDSNADGLPDGPLVASTTTSAGLYIFTGVEPGLYVLV